jgi:hypothetical protein
MKNQLFDWKLAVGRWIGILVGAPLALLLFVLYFVMLCLWLLSWIVLPLLGCKNPGELLEICPGTPILGIQFWHPAVNKFMDVLAEPLCVFIGGRWFLSGRSFADLIKEN